MTSSRTPRPPGPQAQRAINGRYLRYSYRYQTWQVQDSLARTWRNVRPELAAAYNAAGFPTGASPIDAQLELSLY